MTIDITVNDMISMMFYIIFDLIIILFCLFDTILITSSYGNVA